MDNRDDICLPLHVAICHENVDMVKYLMKNGVNQNIICKKEIATGPFGTLRGFRGDLNGECEDCLYRALASGNIDIVKIILNIDKKYGNIEFDWENLMNKAYDLSGKKTIFVQGFANGKTFECLKFVFSIQDRYKTKIDVTCGYVPKEKINVITTLTHTVVWNIQ